MTVNTHPIETQKYHWLLVAYSFKRREISGTGSFTHGVLDEGQSTNITKSDLSFMKKQPVKNVDLLMMTCWTVLFCRYHFSEP